MKCPNCGGHNPDYRRKCEYCSAVLERPPLDSDQERLRDQLLSMSLSTEDLFTLAFGLGIDWHEMEEEQGEAEKAEMMARMLASEGRISEVSLALRDFKFPTSYAPLPGPYPDNLYLTYVFAVQNITSLAQLQALCDQLDLGNAETLPGVALPHKIREVLRLSKQYNRLTRVHEWLQTLKPKEGLKRPDRQRRRRT
jgi:hypothetical protein